MRFRGGLALLAIGFVSGTAACASGSPPASPGGRGVTSAQMTDGKSAASRLADMTCQHAAACHQIGESKTYTSEDACVTENRARFEKGLRAAECPRGVDTTRVEACVSEVTAESCTGMPGGFNRMTSCKRDALCL